MFSACTLDPANPMTGLHQDKMLSDKDGVEVLKGRVWERGYWTFHENLSSVGLRITV